MSSYNRGYNEDLFKARKTRMESLDDRIKDAETFLNSLLPKEKKEEETKVENEEEEKKNETNKEEEKTEKLTENTKSSNTQKFISKMQKMIEELEKLKNKSADPSEIQTEISNLPSYSLIQLSFSKVSVKKQYEKQKIESNEKDNYIKRLEEEVVKGRLDMEKIKKNESENMIKISSLEDQIRILKSKVFGYDIGKKYEYYKDHQDLKVPVGKIEDENLAFSMWEKENYNSRAKPNKFNQMENEKDMWIKNSQNNIDQLVKNVNNSNSFNMRNGSNNNDPWVTKPNNNNPYGNNLKNGQSGLGNMRRFTPTILNNNKY